MPDEPRTYAKKEHEVDDEEDQHAIRQLRKITVVERSVFASHQELKCGPSGCNIVAEEERRPAHCLVLLRVRSLQTIEKQLDEQEPHNDHCEERDPKRNWKSFGLHKTPSAA